MEKGKMPDLTRLQRILRESKATSATGQALLDDPEGVELKERLQDTLEKALKIGRLDVAGEAAEILENLNQKEGEVRRTQRVSDAAEQHGVETIVSVLNEFGDKH